MNDKMVLWGSGLIVLALTPTPDDVTVISPVHQFVVGSALLIGGLLKKK